MCIRTVSSGEFHLALDVLEKAFPDVSRRFFHAITQHDPWYNEKFGLALETGKKLASYLQLFDRTLLIEGKPIRFGGIGSVGTRPRYKGKGYASKLMKHAEQVMQEENMQGGLLFTKIHPFYEKLGWKTLPLQEQEVSIHEIQLEKKSNLYWKPFKENNIETLHEIYVQEQTHLSGTLQRIPAYWKARPNWMDHTCIIIFCDDEIIAYLYGAKYRENVPTMHITEYGLKSHNEQTACALFQSAKELAIEKKCRDIRINLLAHPFLTQFIGEKNWKWDNQPYNYIMWKDVNHSGLYNQLEQLANQNRFIYWQTDAF